MLIVEVKGKELSEQLVDYKTNFQRPLPPGTALTGQPSRDELMRIVQKGRAAANVASKVT